MLPPVEGGYKAVHVLLAEVTFDRREVVFDERCCVPTPMLGLEPDQLLGRAACHVVTKKTDLQAAGCRSGRLATVTCTIAKLEQRSSTKGDDAVRADGQAAASAPELAQYLDDAGFEVLRLDQDKLLRAFCRKVPTRVFEHRDGLAPFGYVDGPRNESTVSGPLKVWRWALDAVKSVEVYVDSASSLGAAALGAPRPDVAPLFPRYTGAATCGFHLEAPHAELAPGHHTLQVIATDEDGSQTDLAGNYLGFSVVE
jgi:hypothetical protein